MESATSEAKSEGLGATGRAAAAFAVFLVLSVALFGFRVVPHLATHYIGWKGADPKIFMWSLAWWPHAIGNGLNPFFANVVWPPVGVNLAWVTGIPGPAIILTPLTMLFGPVVTYNLLVILSPALSAWAAYLVCRKLGATFLPSIVGGYLYGFTAYQIGHLLVAHPNLVLVPFAPLAVYVFLRRREGTLGSRSFVALLTGILVLQFLTSTELFLTMTLFAGVALGIALIAAPKETRPALLRDTVLVGIAYAVTGLLVSPYLYYALTNLPPKSIQSPEHFALDLLAFVVPTKTAAFGTGTFEGVASRFIGNYDVQNGYLGFPILGAFFLFAASWWRTLIGKVLAISFVVFAVLSLGPVMHIAGVRTLPLPWRGIWSVPILENMLPGRFMMYGFLVLGFALALWLSAKDDWRPVRWVLVIVGLVLLLPNRSFITWDTPTEVPPFITQGMYERVLDPGETVAIVPYTSNVALLWQTKSHFYFNILEGWLGQIPEPYRDMAIVHKLIDAKVQQDDAPELRRFFLSHGVHTLIVEGDAYLTYWRKRLEPLDPSPREVGGVFLLTIGGAASGT